jgi:hypothetical protein
MKITESVSEILSEEISLGLNRIEVYTNFQPKIDNIKYNAVKKLSELKLSGKTVIAYGAAAKGNTFLNYCGTGREIFDCVADVTPEKQGLYLPGTMIPIVDENHIRKIKPDYIVILPWNWRNEVVTRLEFTREWGCKFIIFIPQTEIF